MWKYRFFVCQSHRPLSSAESKECKRLLAALERNLHAHIDATRVLALPSNITAYDPQYEVKLSYAPIQIAIVLWSLFFLIYLKTKLLRINLKVKHCEAP